MSKELAIQEDNYDILSDVEQTQNAVKKLLQTKHFQQLGEAGVFAIIQKAKSLKINAFDALSGSLYFLNGKTGMSAEMMNTLIRNNGHSITKDSKSNDTVCILHGKRKDNGDTWTESFSIEDAKRAGIYNDKTPWGKYPRNMCFNRALSNLARQLFPDVIKGCYEIDELKSFAESPMSFSKTTYEAEVEIKERAPELSEEDKNNFYENFNGDVEMTRKYIQMCMKKMDWSESQAILKMQQDLVKSADAYNKWKAKQSPKEIPVATETLIVINESEGE